MLVMYIDCETTGIDKNINSIIEIGCIVVKDGIQVEKFHRNIRPYKGDTLTEIAASKTGLTNEQINNYDDQKLAFNDFIGLLNKYTNNRSWSNKGFFVGYNSTFDADFINEWFKFNNNNYFTYYFWLPTIDVMQVANMYLIPIRSTMKRFTLEYVYEFILGKPLKNSHSALGDIEATKELFDYLMKNNNMFHQFFNKES